MDHADGALTCKIVYWGPGLAGRTTNLECVHGALDAARRSPIVRVDTDVERSLDFELDVEVGGLALRVHLCTVPGQVFDGHACRARQLAGADAIVCVWDSQVERMAANLDYAGILAERLAEIGVRPAAMPMVHQYNKRDLSDIVGLEAMQRQLNPRALPSFPAVATRGEGVRATLDAALRLIVDLPRARGPAGRVG